MYEPELSQGHAQSTRMESQETLTYPKLYVRTASRTEWLQLSPEKVKGYFYELGTISARSRHVDDISFSSVLDMSSLNINELEDQGVFVSSLNNVLECNIREDARTKTLSNICGSVLLKPEYALLRHQVNKLMEADLVAAAITINSESSIYMKSTLMATYLARKSFIRQTRHPEKEFRINLSTLSRRQAGNCVKVLLHFSYGISFGALLAILTVETILQTDKGGFTLKDGPWKYSMVVNGKIRGLWFDLKDETSFDDLIHNLKASEGEAIMIHSVEDAVERRYQKNKKEEWERSQDEEVVLGHDGKPFFCSSSFMEYLEMQQK